MGRIMCGSRWLEMAQIGLDRSELYVCVQTFCEWYMWVQVANSDTDRSRFRRLGAVLVRIDDYK
jgi:hypothetical protein